MITLFRSLPLTAVLLIACWIGLRVRGDRFTALRALPDARLAPAAVALVTMGVIWYLWGSLRQVPVFHDEASYLLQAETFAHLRWAMASPPLPSFFEQFHVFVTPTFASKYPPGHGILLVPGIWLGLPGLVPLLFNGLAAAILFVLVRRVTNGWVALITFALWLPMQENLWFRASYFSEITTSVLWLLGWFALLKWRETAQQRWLSTVAACTAWMAITRPLTALAFALPVGAVVLWDISRQRKWRSLVYPAVLGLAILCLLPVWNAKTTGNWRETPYGLYSKIYFPFDAMGFGRDTTPATRPLPTDMQHFTQAFGPVHATHTVDRLPRILYDRWSALFDEAFSGLRRGAGAVRAGGVDDDVGGWLVCRHQRRCAHRLLPALRPPGSVGSVLPGDRSAFPVFRGLRDLDHLAGAGKARRRDASDVAADDHAAGGACRNDHTRSAIGPRAH